MFSNNIFFCLFTDIMTVKRFLTKANAALQTRGPQGLLNDYNDHHMDNKIKWMLSIHVPAKNGDNPEEITILLI